MTSKVLLQNFFTKLYKVLEEATSACKSDFISLSGGLDSTILAYYLKKRKINAITVIASDFVATDLTYCQMVAKKFELPLEMNTVSTKDLLSAIEQTIKILKVFNDIEIRNSVVMYLVLKYLKENGYNYLVTGDGADELFAGYSFFLKKNEKELRDDLERIWNIMHFTTNLLGKKMGITIESPFLMKDVVEFAKNIPVNLLVKQEGDKKYGKWLLRKAFEDKIPKTIAWRDKSPMQDGAGTTGLSNLFESLISEDQFNTSIKKIRETDDVIIQSKESFHYYEIFRKYYEAPNKLHSSSTICPYCKYEVKLNTKFCRMCGSYPI